MLVFQHNNLKATEWAGIRRELVAALNKVDEELARNGNQEFASIGAKFQVVQTGIFASALRVVEFWNPNFDLDPPVRHPTDPQTVSSAPVTDAKGSGKEDILQHGLSKMAHHISKKNSKSMKHGLEPLLSGPIALLTLPTVSPQHLKAALSILAPSSDFPAPKRRARPSYHEPAVQNGLQKLMLLGARIEGKAFDLEGAKWVGSIDGGLEGLRAQMVAMLQGTGAAITNSLEAATKSLYLTVEGRRMMLEDQEKESAGGKPE